MPKFSRRMDPLVGETSVKTKHASSSNSSSPLVPHLSIQMLPQHTEESNEVAQINSPSNHNFSLSSPVEQNQSDLMTPPLLSPDPLGIPKSHLDSMKINAFISPRKRKASPEGSCSKESISFTSEKDDSLNLGKDAMDISDEGFCSMQMNSSISPEKKQTRPQVRDSDESRRDSTENLGKTCKADERNLADANQMCDSQKDFCDAGSGELPCGKQSEGGAACAVTGFVTLTARNGDSMMHGVLPSVIPSHQGAGLNSCFPGSDGNWYQIISASIPPVVANPPVSVGRGSNDNSQDKTTNTTTTCGTSNTSTGSNSINLLPSLPLATTLGTASTTNSTNVTTTTTPVTASDSLLSFLQQYASGTDCSPDIHTSLPALHLPLNLATAGTTQTPRYLYATNPRTGQLLILSSLGSLGGAQTQQQQQLQLQQQVTQLPQQEVKSQEKTVWKSPLGEKQQENILSTAAEGLLTKQTGKPGSLVSKLLLNKPPTSTSLSQKSEKDENMPSVAAARELLALASPARARLTGQSSVPPPLFHSSPGTPTDEPIRENHNMKERRRRARIKDACDLMRQLVPGMSEKTDKATVFEFSARYIHFLKNIVGPHHDKDFLIKYSPY